MENSMMKAHRRFWRIAVRPLLCFTVAWVPLARADVITMNDGRTFEGTIAAEKNGTVQFDTVVSGIRARLSLARSDIKAIEKKPLSESAEDTAAIDPGLSEPAAGATGPNLYLEIPIKGRLKEQVFTQAIRSALVYAKKNKIRHIVFTVDSTGGALDEAGAIYRTLKLFEKDLEYHAIIKNCTGEALIVPFLCKTVHIQPGGQVGGSSQQLQGMPARFAKKDEDVVRAQLGEELAEAAQQRGRTGNIIRAMVDPTVELAAWTSEDGTIEQGRRPPPQLPAGRLIFADGPDTVLVLSYEQATRLGLPGIEGGPDALGAALGLSNWREESTTGRDAANRAIAARKKAANTAQAKFEDAVTRNIRMRETTNRAIEANLRQAAAWNPTDASYKTLSVYWGAYWNPQAFDTSLWTPDSRARWRTRSEACASFLTKARDGISAMIRLDKEAAALGLSPSFREGDLQLMLDDVNAKLDMVSRSMNRVGE
jgi:hypothetical protein